MKRVKCPECPTDSANDNLIMYDDGGYHCFACGNHKAPTAVSTYREEPAMKKFTPIEGKYDNLPSRKILSTTCEKYSYQVGKHKDKYIHIANYISAEGAVIGQKIRDKDKNIWWKGSAVSDSFYGQWLFKPSKNKTLVVVEGEIDALSVYQHTSNLDVVSLASGAQSAVRTLQKQQEWVMGYGRVVLAFDSDEAGQAAQKECKDVLEAGTVELAIWPLKDANEMLLASRESEIIEVLSNAQAPRSDSVISAEDIFEDILRKPEKGESWPWESLTKATYGIHKDSIYTIGAGSGQGKTTLLLSIAHHLSYVKGNKVGAMFLESRPSDIYLQLAGIELGKRLHVPDDTTNWDTGSIEKALDKSKGLIYLYDASKEGVKGGTWEVVRDKIIYMSKSLGVKYIILDHLTALAAYFQDERKAIDKTMAELGNLVHSLGITLFLVSHLAKPNGEVSYEEGKSINAGAFRGSQSIQFWSSYMLGLERNKLAEDPHERNLINLRVLKDRKTGDSEGMVIRLQYDRNTGRIIENHEAF